jgi:thiopeptide-type bacteriocin biosynthesis protein
MAANNTAEAIRARSRTWASAYMYFHAQSIHDEVADSIATDVVARLSEKYLAQELITGWFFVRYDEGSPHIRWRLSPAEGLDSATLMNLIDQDIIDCFPQAERIPAALTARAASGTIHLSPGDRYRVTHWTWVDYQPEVRRYGGEHAIPVAEDVFIASTMAAIGALRLTVRDRGSRLGNALVCSVVMLWCFGRANASEVLSLRDLAGFHFGPGQTRDAKGRIELFERTLTDQKDRIRNQVRTVVSQLDSEEPLTDWLDVYRRRLRASAADLLALYRNHQVGPGWSRDATWVACIRHLLPSYLHMMHNRLGLKRMEEWLVSYVLCDALDGD